MARQNNNNNNNYIINNNNNWTVKKKLSLLKVTILLHAIATILANRLKMNQYAILKYSCALLAGLGLFSDQ